MHPSSIARLAWRGPVFALALAYDAWRYLREVRGPDRAARARWLHRCCRRAARIFRIEVKVLGALPERGLIVANHLSYADIIALSVALPCLFVSKMEVADWPLFGTFARRSGTLFLDRKRRGAVGDVAAQMRGVLGSGIPLVLFPEGTSTHGDTVTPFKTSLFEPVSDIGCAVTAAAIGYAMPEGSVRDEVHFWGGMKLGSHLLNFLGKRRIDVTICFGEARVRTGNRKTIAAELHGEIVSLRTSR